MIIWRGWGILVLLIGEGIAITTSISLELLTGTVGYYEDHNWCVSISMIVAAVICWYGGKALNKPNDKIYINKKTGEEYMKAEGQHRFFYIRMEYWALVYVIISIRALLNN